MLLPFPDNKRFAFTIFDDTDLATVQNVRPVYDHLRRCGIRTTKSVWTLAPTEPSRIGGATLAEPEYRDFVLEIHAQGVEIASHGATSHSATREQTLEALDRFKHLFGHYPKIHCNHSMNRDNIYWGAARLTTRRYRWFYRLATLMKDRRYEGHVEASPYFWGDLCRKHIRYVRNFVFWEINLLNVSDAVPYHDPAKPYVNYWFTSTQAADVDAFCGALATEAQQRLQDEGGVCILYTHFGSGFVRNGKLDERFCRLIYGMAERDGWFVPAGDLLDWLHERQDGGTIAPRDLAALERRWLVQKMTHRTPYRTHNPEDRPADTGERG